MRSRISYLPLILAPALVLSPSLFAQAPQSCRNGYATDKLGSITRMPFTGEFRTYDAKVGPPNDTYATEHVARDWDGRVRSDAKRYIPTLKGNTSTVTMPDGSTHTVTDEELSELVLIQDCSGNTIRLQPALRIARVRADNMSSSSPDWKYSGAYFPSANSKSNPEIQFEDLGVRDIQGFRSHGALFTTMGTEKDGDWDGRPISSFEHWVSDDLAASLLVIRKNFRTGSEFRTELVEIRLVDPDPSLFNSKVPEGYLLNPSPREMPTVSGFQVRASAPIPH